MGRLTNSIGFGQYYCISKIAQFSEEEIAR